MPPEPDEPGLRDRKKEQTRRSLREGAARLFAERGFARTTVEDIAAQANVSKRTFFRYFDSKEDLLLPDLAELFAKVEAELAARPTAEDPLTAVRAALLAAAGAFVGSSLAALAHPFEEEAGAGPAAGLAAGRLAHAFTEFEDRLSELVRLRLPAEEPDADLRAAVIAGAALATVRAVLRTRRSRRRAGLPDAGQLDPGGADGPAPLLHRAFDTLTRIGTSAG
jgi:AcrR family transcriptional regulator